MRCLKACDDNGLLRICQRKVKRHFSHEKNNRVDTEVARWMPIMGYKECHGIGLEKYKGASGQ